MEEVLLPSGEWVELPKRTVTHVRTTFPNEIHLWGLVYSILAKDKERRVQKNTPE